MLGKAADMARLADYFVVVGYDQEKSGKLGRRGGSQGRRWLSRPPVTVEMMLMLL